MLGGLFLDWLYYGRREEFYNKDGDIKFNKNYKSFWSWTDIKYFKYNYWKVINLILLLIWFIQCFVSMITAGYINMIFVTVQLDVSQNLWGGCLAWCAQQLQSTKWLPFHLSHWCIWHQMEVLFLCPFQQHTLDQHQSWLAFCLLSGGKAWYVTAREGEDIQQIWSLSWAKQSNSHFFAHNFNIVYRSVSVSFKYSLIFRLFIYLFIIIIIYCSWFAPGGSSLTPLHTINTIS
jgi:hypothetical protein